MYRRNFKEYVKEFLDSKLEHEGINYTSLKFFGSSGKYFFNYGFSSKKIYGGFAKINLTRDQWEFIMEGSDKVKLAA